MVNSNKTKLVLLGGFLGSGKTTLMMKLSSLLMERGKKVAVITNDQEGYLVDTAFSQNMGIPSAEVTSGCFCCNFPDLISNIKTLAEEHGPDYIIAEAVGSCTDLNATVLLPLKEYHSDLVELAANFVLVDGARLLDEYAQMDLLNPRSPKETLISHQIAEATTILISKSDFLDEEDRADSLNLAGQINGEASIYTVSSRTGESLERLMDLIESEERVEVNKTVPLDYDLYARAEAEYGWYNGQWKYVFPVAVDPEVLGRDLMEELKKTISGDMAHGKILIRTREGSVKISLAGTQIDSDLSGTPEASVEMEVILNIRAAVEPDYIVQAVDAVLSRFRTKYRSWLDYYTYSSLVPAPPEPTYRLAL